VLTDALVRANFRARGPWVTRFSINGHTYGGWCDFTDDERLRDFLDRFAPCRVLELGCLEGGQTIELALRGFDVTAVEGRPENVKRARWICRLLGVDADVVNANLERVPLRELGWFDVVFCAGLLYHLPSPWEMVEQFPAVAPSLFLSTHYAEREEVVVNGLPGRWYPELGRDDPLSGLSQRSFWPTKYALLDLLRASGYKHVEITRDWMHPNGPLLNLTASIDPPGLAASST
jgi:SAM-dependent methyltransferase